MEVSKQLDAPADLLRENGSKISDGQEADDRQNQPKCSVKRKLLTFPEMNPGTQTGDISHSD
jgi:hypothetical protein